MKILVFTVAAWSGSAGTDYSTWAELLAEYAPANIANICIRDEQPNSPVCSRYFSISENKILKSIFHRRLSTGKEMTSDLCTQADESDLLAHQARYKKMSLKRRYSMLLARELVWKLGCWKTPELDAFLDDFKPNIILHGMDGYIHLNRLVAYAIKRTGARAAGYIWDDNFSYKQSNGIGYKVYRFFQRRSLRQLAKATDAFFAISPYTKKEADSFFGISCRVLTKPLNAWPEPQQYEGNNPLRIVYTGNLLIGRYKALGLLNKALQELPRHGKRFILDVYTQTELRPETLSRLQEGGCRIHAAIPPAEALQKQKEADILLFLEALDGEDARMARLSFSSKITDYLSCGKCILAIGNRETAPMQYFMENDAALVCDSADSLHATLNKLRANNHLLNHYAQSASKAGIRHHQPESIRRTFRETLEQLSGAA